jgi:hypothetical protein
MLLLISLLTQSNLLGAAGISEKIKRSSFCRNSLLGAEEAPQKVTKISHEKHVLGKKLKIEISSKF